MDEEFQCRRDEHLMTPVCPGPQTYRDGKSKKPGTKEHGAVRVVSSLEDEVGQNSSEIPLRFRARSDWGLTRVVDIIDSEVHELR
jgi:hypothetical protein